MAQRIYKAAAIYDSRAVGLRNLWEPSREYMGKPTEKPTYMISVIMKKTRANWFEEPALTDFTRAASELYGAALSHIPFQQIEWPIKDGDIPQPGRTQADWARGHWFLTGTSNSPIETMINQGGVAVPLRGRVGVKPGDYTTVSVSLAVKANDPRGVKCYINKCIFMAPGEEIVVGSSVSADDLMAQAKAQGLNVTGFGGGGAPQQGFGQMGPPGLPGTSAPMGFPAGPTVMGPSGTGGPGSGSAFPSNGPQQGFAPPPVQPPGQQGFGAPGGFTPPTGFPQRS
jgi:hypothetical protein